MLTMISRKGSIITCDYYINLSRDKIFLLIQFEGCKFYIGLNTKEHTYV